LYGINVASQAADDHVPCVLQRTLTPYKILYSARRMPRKLTEQFVRSKEAADVARYSVYVRGTSSYSSRTAHLHTVHGTPSSCYDMKPQTSLGQMSGQRIHQTSIQLTIGCGGWYKNASIRQRFGTQMIWSSALPVSGLSWSKASLIKPLNSGGQGWELAFAQRDNTLNSC